MKLYIRCYLFIALCLFGCVNSYAASKADKKYEITDACKLEGDEAIKVCQVKALRDIYKHAYNADGTRKENVMKLVVKQGSLGGFIEREANLSQTDGAWIDEDVVIKGNAKVYDDARISGNVKLSADAEIYGNASIRKDYTLAPFKFIPLWLGLGAKVYGMADIHTSFLLLLRGEVFGNATLRDWVIIAGKDSVKIYGNAILYSSSITENARVYGNAIVGNPSNYNIAKVHDNAKVYGTAIVMGKVSGCMEFHTGILFKDEVAFKACNK